MNPENADFLNPTNVIRAFQETKPGDLPSAVSQRRPAANQELVETEEAP
jgi:hypothetical protein